MGTSVQAQWEMQADESAFADFPSYSIWSVDPESELEALIFCERGEPFFLNFFTIDPSYQRSDVDELNRQNAQLLYRVGQGRVMKTPIFFAVFYNEIVGTVALINQKSFFELSKMAVSPKYYGLKIGQKLMDYCITFAKNKQWKSITLYSNKKLIPAITLYKKVGFKEVPLEENSHYKRSNIKMLLEL
mgnify:CR=1 FL=1